MATNKKEERSDRSNQTIVYLVRHAIPDSHEENGHLTAQGYAQAKEISKFFSHEFSANTKPLLIVSPTVRTLETADPIVEKLGVRPLLHSAFSENYLADTQNIFLSPAFLRQHVATHKIIHAFWHAIRSNKGKKIIIVTHGNVIRVLLGKLFGKSFLQMSKTKVDCGSITQLAIVGEKAHHVNSGSHLVA